MVFVWWEGGEGVGFEMFFIDVIGDRRGMIVSIMVLCGKMV